MSCFGRGRDATRRRRRQVGVGPGNANDALDASSEQERHNYMQPLVIAIFGLDQAGKSSVLMRLKKGTKRRKQML